VKEAIDALWHIDTPVAAVSYLMQAIKDPEYPYRHLVASVLANNGSDFPEHPEVFPALCDYFLEVSDPKAYYFADDIKKIGGKEAIAVLLKYAKDAGKPERDRVAEELSELDSDELDYFLISCVEDRSNRRRHAIAFKLAERGVKAAVPAIVKYLTYELDGESRDAAAALGLIGDESVVPCLVEYAARCKSYEQLDFRWIHNVRSAMWAMACIGGELAWDTISDYMVERRGFGGLRDFVKFMGEKTGRDALRLQAVIVEYEKLRHHNYSFARSIHRRIKPQGYNPPARGVATQNVKT